MAVSVLSSPSATAREQLQLQVAQRSAERAQQNARSLKSEADSAQQTANRAQEKARGLQVEADQAQANAERASDGLKTREALSSRMSELYDRLNQARATPNPSAVASVSEAGKGVLVDTKA